MSNIGDATPGSSVPSCGSNKASRPPRLVCTSRIVRQAVQQTPMPIPPKKQNLRDSSLGSVSKTVRQVVQNTPMPIRHIRGVSEATTQDVQQIPSSASGDIEDRIQDFQKLKKKNSFVGQFMHQQLSSLRDAIRVIPTTDPAIKEVRNTLLEMADHKVITSQKNKEATRQKLLSLIYSGEKTLENLEQKVLKQYPNNRKKTKIQINIIRGIMKRTCDFIQCFKLDKIEKELDKSKTYDDLLKMRNDFKKQGLTRFFMEPLDISTRTIGKYPNKDAQAARLITILQQIPELKQYIAASEQASSSNVMGEQEAGTSGE